MAKRASLKGVMGTISPSNRKNKKWKFVPDNPKYPTVHAGAKGYRIKPGTKAGDNYCTRSLGIKSKKPYGPNDLARKQWNCVGKKSKKPT